MLNEEAFDIMRRWQSEYNVGFILDTMRHGKYLDVPLEILKQQGINLYGIGGSPRDIEGGHKIFSVFVIDDKCVGVPTMMDDGCDRQCVDWKKVDEIMTPILEEMKEILDKSSI